MEMKIYCDGGSRGNPGPSASAIVVKLDNKLIHKASNYLGQQTNNYAEYSALIMGLSWIYNFEKKDRLSKIDIFMDSELVVRHMKGLYKVKSKNIKPLFLKAKNLENKINIPLKYYSVPRDKNKLADKLVNLSIDASI